ncbi:hypothetical protein [Pseudomonas phage PPAY]|nr:hypothetical protein [Pseudomonas phage PPAY]UCW44444.1 hypothetical protein [Pseudomonas phage PPAT]
MNLDPIVALAGAAYKTGNQMFAIELLSQGAAVSIAMYQSQDAELVGMDCKTVAAVIDDRIQRNDSPLK